jgi:hypothetical protein
MGANYLRWTTSTKTLLNPSQYYCLSALIMLCEISEQYGFFALWAALSAFGAISVLGTWHITH